MSVFFLFFCLLVNKVDHMSFRLVTKSVTLNDLERRNAIILHYFAEFCSFRGKLRKKPLTDFLPRNVIKYTMTDALCSSR